MSQLPFADNLAGVHVVVLASEQLWPNLESVCLYREKLRGLHVLHTENERVSARPARTIANIVTSQFGVEPRLICVGMQPVEVSRAVHSVIEAAAPAPVVLNATGGTKLMTAGMLRWVGHPNTATIYRELNRRWFLLVRAEDNRQIRSVPLDAPEAPTDVLDVRVLVTEMLSQGQYEVRIEGEPQDLPVAEIAQRLAETAGDPSSWQHAFETVVGSISGRGGQTGAGFLFEQFVGACLRFLGVDNVVMNVEQRDGVTVLQELDLVANSGGRLCIIDCKLRGNAKGGQAVVSQCLTAAQIRRHFAGLSGGYLLVRPNWEPRPWIRDLCRQLGLEIIDADGFGKFCSRLATFLGIHGVEDRVTEIDRWLTTYNDKRPLPGLLEPKSPVGQEFADKTVGNSVARVDAWLDEILRGGQTNWASVAVGPYTLLVVDLREIEGDHEFPATELARRTVDRVTQLVTQNTTGSVLTWKCGKSNRRLYVVLEKCPDLQKVLGDFVLPS